MFACWWKGPGVDTHSDNSTRRRAFDEQLCSHPASGMKTGRGRHGQEYRAAAAQTEKCIMIPVVTAMTFGQLWLLAVCAAEEMARIRTPAPRGEDPIIAVACCTAPPGE
ncbi:unnamed protein product [Pleuronectes platessa]|uniref:Uncharacterized protein n=1 Tax=Pleuronectes platessa TaxID=8262 RepID=A0A9N7V319_PLEPL|nr:unnamed protein product [Pleuronectes platessa]